MRNSLIAAVAAFSVAAPAAMAQTNDVDRDAWYFSATQNLAARYGCLAGYPDGTFKPAQEATRAELAAMVSSCLDRITHYQNEADAKLASALRAEFAQEMTRISSLELASERRNRGVGNYLGAGVFLNEQGVEGGGEASDDIVSGATLQGRYRFAEGLGGEFSARPYVNLTSDFRDSFNAAGGVTLTYDRSVASRALADGSRVSVANVYGGVGIHTPFTSDDLEGSRQSAIGQETQAVFVLGVEGRLTNSLVGFADVKFPATESGEDGYNPVLTTGLGFKF